MGLHLESDFIFIESSLGLIFEILRPTGKRLLSARKEKHLYPPVQKVLVWKMVFQILPENFFNSSLSKLTLSYSTKEATQNKFCFVFLASLLCTFTVFHIYADDNCHNSYLCISQVAFSPVCNKNSLPNFQPSPMSLYLISISSIYPPSMPQCQYHVFCFVSATPNF